jgi:polar amino acid transport system substrate-binding protein
LVFALFFMISCSEQATYTELEQLEGKVFAVPTGTVGDQLVLQRFTDVEFQYYNTVLDCALAVKNGNADAAAYDEPILRNIAAKQSGLVVLPELITVDNYGFGIRLEDVELKAAADKVIRQIREDGTYDQMIERWLPDQGEPGDLPVIELTGTNGTIVLGTAAITEPFSFIGPAQQVTGFDIELAYYIARELDMNLEIVDMEFGGLIPALISGKVDMIAALITITDERAERILFSESYYTGGIAALVRE